MRYFALATDYDGTLATDGKVDEATLNALQKLKQSGRKLLLVTGRHLDDLCTVFPQLDWFDCVVAENGALLYYPATREEKLLGDRPPESFIQALAEKQVDPLGVGRVIVSTWEPHEVTVLQTIRELGLELQVIFNKGAVMVLPSGINKATGLHAALNSLGLSTHNTVGVGDAENDHAFLDVCECSVVVANALPILKDKVDWVTQGARGAGVCELVDRLIADDLSTIANQAHHQILMGNQEDKTGVYLPYGSSVLLAGISGGGKSTLATGILERLGEEGYQFCIFDPEGDYETFDDAVVVGNRDHIPRIDEVLNLLEQPDQQVVINLLGVPLDQRPAFFASFLPALLELRSRIGRPHWIVMDEVHHLIPTTSNPATLALPQTLANIMMITVHPEHVATPALQLINTVVALGKAPEQTISAFCTAIAAPAPNTPAGALETGTALAWFKSADSDPFPFKIEPPQTERRRHMRNYAEGALGEDKHFVFRGEQQKLKLRAQNLISFTQLAEGIDDETWLYHLQQQDYSKWFRESLKDDELAEQAAAIETMPELSPIESRERIRQAIEARYTLPA